MHRLAQTLAAALSFSTAGGAAAQDRCPEPPPQPRDEDRLFVSEQDVAETAHSVNVHLSQGLATVEVTLELSREEAQWTEVLYHLPLPPGAGLGHLRVCNANGCRAGLPDDEGVGAAFEQTLYAPMGRALLPIAMARPGWRRGQRVLEIRAAPVGARDPLRLEVGYVAPTELMGNLESFEIPARGSEAAFSPAIVSVGAPGRAPLRVNGEAVPSQPLRVEACRRVRIEAVMPAGVLETSATALPCGDQRCVRARVAAGFAPPVPRDATLLIDASPSMTGVPSGRLEAALLHLSESLPEGSRLSVVAFATHARRLVARPLAAARAVRAVTPERLAFLGPSTRCGPAWRLLSPAPGRPPTPVILMGDGQLDPGGGDFRTLAALVDAGVELFVVNLSDDATEPPLAEAARRSGGAVVELGTWATDPAEAPRRLALLSAPVVEPRVTLRHAGGAVDLGPLRAGEELAWEGALPGAVGLRLSTGAVPARLPAGRSARGLAVRLGSAHSTTPIRGDTLTAVDPRDLRLSSKWSMTGQVVGARGGIGQARPRYRPPRIQFCGGCSIRGAVSRESLSRMLATVRPRVRGCFRRARSGRSNYRARVVFQLVLQGRELETASVTGDLTPDLERCLLSSLDHLQPPLSAGRVLVRYPFVAAPLAAPAPVPLEPPVAAAVDELF